MESHGEQNICSMWEHGMRWDAEGGDVCVEVNHEAL